METEIIIQIGKKNMYLNAVRDLAKQVYDEKDVSPISKYMALYKKCPEAFIFAFEKKSNILVGYIINLPITKEYFEASLKPDFKEDNLTDKIVEPFKLGVNRTYIFSIVAKPKHPKNLTILRELLMAHLNQLRKLTSQGKYVMEVSALALTDIGKKLCQGLDMEQLGENEKGVVFVNKQFQKIYMNQITKENILKTFVYFKRQREISSENP